MNLLDLSRYLHGQLAEMLADLPRRDGYFVERPQIRLAKSSTQCPVHH